jgi:hypothetical protein
MLLSEERAEETVGTVGNYSEGGLVKVKGGAKPAKAHDASRTKCCRNLAQIITIIMYSTGTVQAKVPLGSFWLTERLFT